MKTERIAHVLKDVTGNLSTQTDEQALHLETIRKIIGHNLKVNRQDVAGLKMPLDLPALEPLEEKLQMFNKYIQPKLKKEDVAAFEPVEHADPVPVVSMQMKGMNLPINPISASTEIRWNQKVTDRVGPFLHDNGLSFWFDLFYYEDKLTVRNKNGNVPAFLFSKARSSHWITAFKKHPRVSLLEGHVWIAAKLLSSSAAANDYIGFRIKEGTFSISNTYQWNGQYLDFDGDFTGTLTLNLEQPQANALVFTGCKPAQQIEFKYPDKIELEWNNGTLTRFGAGTGSFNGYDNDLTFSDFTTALEYRADLNSILIPCHASQSQWSCDLSGSALINVKGDAGILKSYWALPLVRVADASTLSEPDNNGGWALMLDTNIRGQWVGVAAEQPQALLNHPILFLYPNALFLYALNTTVIAQDSDVIREEFLCWQVEGQNARIPIPLEFRDSFPLLYYCHATAGETLMLTGGSSLKPDKPVYADGKPLSLKDMKGWVAFHREGDDITISLWQFNANALKSPFRMLVLQNALLICSQPLGYALQGTLTSGRSIDKGALTILQGQSQWRPILPDPYVSNLAEGMVNREKQITSLLYGRVQWSTPVNPVVKFYGEMASNAGAGIKPQSSPQIKGLPIKPSPEEAENIRKYTINNEQKERKQKIDQPFDSIEESLNGWKLLDVSTNMDLIGVSIIPRYARIADQPLTHAVAAASSTQPSLVIRDMALHTPLHTVHVFTVPQIQWEPVRTLPQDQNPLTLGWFPETLGSINDGGPTRIIGLSTTLAPAIPDVVVKHIKERFDEGSEAAAITTLSFGLKAALRLTPVDSSSRNRDSLECLQPQFPDKDMKGGIQIKMTAESGHAHNADKSPGFQGSMAQTLNGYDLLTGTELGLSVLGATLQPEGSVESQFNEEFAQGAATPFVPVTRFDIAGYGASNFSEWEHPRALAQIAKVQFKVMVGRTAFEVVKFVSKIYPWGITVTRSVTIERRSGGGVIRKDSGWQAGSPGIFDFTTTQPTPYTFKPGLFRGCFDVKNIRPASNDVIKFTDPSPLTPFDTDVLQSSEVEMAPVYFDAKVKIDDQETVSVGILGFVQLKPKGQLLSPEAFRELIRRQHAIGGPVDTTLNIGNSGLRFRANRIEVDYTDNGSQINFVGIVRGQPVLPQNGSWSVIKMAAPGNTTDPQEAVSSDVSLGTPLFINNDWSPPSGNDMVVSSASGPYRFVDAADIFAAQPRYDYGFLQNTGSQAFLFRRPQIVSGTNEITSLLKPAFADPFALVTTKGVFPPIANAIEFPSVYKLVVQSSTGKFRLNAAVDFTNLRTPLVVMQDGSDQITLEYDQARLQFVLNEDNWSVQLDNFYQWTSLMGISKFSGIRYNLRSGTNQQSRLVNVQSLLKPEVQEALNFLPGMGAPSSVGDIDLGMTNASHEVKVHTSFQTPNLIPPPLKEKVELKLKGSAGVDSEYDTNTRVWQAFFGATAGAELQGKIPVVGIVFVVLGLELEVALGSSTSPTASTPTTAGFKSLEIDAYVGVGVGGNIGPFKAEAFIAVGIVFVYEDNTAKLGGLVKLEAEIDLKVVEISVSAELKGVIYKGDDPETPAVETGITLCDASGSVAVNISIFLIINISASYEYKTTQKL